MILRFTRWFLAILLAGSASTMLGCAQSGGGAGAKGLPDYQAAVTIATAKGVLGAHVWQRTEQWIGHSNISFGQNSNITRDHPWNYTDSWPRGHIYIVDMPDWNDCGGVVIEVKLNGTVVYRATQAAQGAGSDPNNMAGWPQAVWDKKYVRFTDNREIALDLS